MHFNVLGIDPYVFLKDLLNARMLELSKMTLKRPCSQAWAVFNLGLKYPCQIAVTKDGI